MRIYSFSPFGYEGSVVAVEVDLRRGIPAVDIVGLADGAVRESRERMRAAIQNSGFDFPPERVLISLSPADVKKEGAGFDLAIGVAVLEASRESRAAGEQEAGPDAESSVKNEKPALEDAVLVMGELELSGNVRPVRGIHAASATAASLGIRRCIVPAANADEAREVSGMLVCGVATLAEAFYALSVPDLFTARSCGLRQSVEPEGCVDVGGVLFPPVERQADFADVAGQGFLVRGLQIAAAGGHNVLAVGTPGCGKTMAMQKFSSLLPLLTVEEAQSVTRIYSLAGVLSQGVSLMRVPPFRMPHQTATIEGMCGGGTHCVPGEISLAHNGVLFLDETSEFRQTVLQMLRVPLESGHITIARAGRSTVYPASFQLLMAANPCPCGNFGSQAKLCVCSTRNREMYWKKFSAPLLDRIDLRIPVKNDGEFAGNFGAERADGSKTENGGPVTTESLRKDIARAVKAQRERQSCRNAKLSPNEAAKVCVLGGEAQNIFDKAARRYNLSPRAMTSCVKIARTIADLAGSAGIGEEHMREAILYRKPCDFIPSE